MANLWLELTAAKASFLVMSAGLGARQAAGRLRLAGSLEGAYLGVWELAEM